MLRNLIDLYIDLTKIYMVSHNRDPQKMSQLAWLLLQDVALFESMSSVINAIEDAKER